MFGFIKSIFDGNGSKIVDAIDELHLSPEEKQNFKARMLELNNQAGQTAAALATTELNSRAEIIKAEMSSGDNFTKRGRPMVLYAGLAMICIIHVIMPIIAWALGKVPPELTLPEQFWWAWGTVVSVYSAGRSAEKMGAKNKLTSMITGR